MAPLILRNLIASLFYFAGKFLFNFSNKYKFLEIIHSFFLRFLPSFSPSTHLVKLRSSKNGSYGTNESGDLGISRALTQLLSIICQIPVSSRKYEVVRSLAEKLIDENHREGIEELREVNRVVLSAAFDRTIAQMEAMMIDRGFCQDGGGSGDGPEEFRFGRVVKAVWSRVGVTVKERANRTGSSAEKLAAEVLWLAEKMASCGCGSEARRRWASAAHLGTLSLSAEPRLQGSLVRVAAFLFKQYREMGKNADEEEEEEASEKHIKLKMLISWLPLLCRGSNGTDAPVLSIGERRELESVLEEMIGALQQDEQEQVLAMWLHHFTHSSSSDWPNLHASYARWYNASRMQISNHKIYPPGLLNVT